MAYFFDFFAIQVEISCRSGENISFSTNKSLNCQQSITTILLIYTRCIVNIGGSFGLLINASFFVFFCISYLVLAALTQVVGEVVVDVGGEHTGILRVEFQHLPQTTHTDILEVTVGERLHVSIGLDHLVCPRQVRPNQVPFS